VQARGLRAVCYGFLVYKPTAEMVGPGPIGMEAGKQCSMWVLQTHGISTTCRVGGCKQAWPPATAAPTSTTPLPT
jgi:hypothetical protein